MDLASSETNETSARDGREERKLAMCLHFSVFTGFLVPFFGLLAPILLWQIYKERYPSLDRHAYVVLNWILSATLYLIVGGLLSFVLIGIPIVIAVSLACIVYPIVGGIKANNGELWSYPFSIRFLKS